MLSNTLSFWAVAVAFCAVILIAQTDAAVSCMSGGNCYEFVSQQVTWNEARIQASYQRDNNLYGHLVTIESSAENYFIGSLIPGSISNPHIWIGASDAQVEGAENVIACSCVDT